MRMVATLRHLGSVLEPKRHRFVFRSQGGNSVLMQNEQDGTLDAFGRRLRSRFVPVTAAIPDEWDEMLSALDRPLADTVAGPEPQTPQD